LAIFGMVIVNFKIVMGAETAGPSWLVWSLGLLDGRAAATFVVLAGVGISLLSRRARESGDQTAIDRDRKILLRRALFLFVVGLAYTPIWPADILHFYGVYIGVSALVLTSSVPRLLGASAGLVVLFMILILVLNYEAGWNWDTLTYSGLWTPQGMFRHLFFNGFHPVVPWLGFMLVGMALGRLDLSDAAVRVGVLRWSVPTVILAEGGSWVLMRLVDAALLPTRETEDLLAIFGTSPMPPAPLYMVAGTATAVTVIVVCVAVGVRHGDSRWIRPLVATGQLALTLYVAHVLLGMGVLDAAGMLEHQSLPFSLISALTFCGLAVVFALVWRQQFRRGPLEWAMRRLTDPRGSPV
jgi:uncharacterized membrane protein YeiB